MKQCNKNILKQLTFCLFVTANSINLANSAEPPHPNRMNNMGNKAPRNPFVKPPSNIPTMPPSGLPPELMAIRDMSDSAEPKDTRFQLINMKIVGVLNKNVLLRVEDLSNMNGQNVNGNNQNGNSGGNTTQAITILATIDKPFLFNKSLYTLGQEKDVYTVYNQQKRPIHSMILESSPIQLIPKNSTGGTGGGNSSASRTNQGASGGTRR